MGRTPKLFLLAFCLFAVTAGGATLAAFSSQTANSGNSFTASANFPGQLKMASGTYTGDGNDNRSITGLGFQPDVVIVKGDTGEVAVLGTSTMTGDESKRLVGGASFDSDRIQAMEADGFQLGKHNMVNGGGRTYYWTAFKAAQGVLKVGTYTGNGGAQAVTGVGFSPEYVILASNNNDRAVQWFADATNTYRFEANAGVSNGVTATGPDGFTVGNAAEVNNNGRTFHYVAFNQVAGNVKVGTYTGNGTSRSVTGVGFEPEYTIVRAQANQAGRHRSQTVPGAQSMFFTNSTNTTDAITGFLADGFQVANHATVNGNGNTYQYVAFNNGAGGCARPGQSQTLIAAGDSWVDQASPATNNGAELGLWVNSEGGANRRIFLNFDLPSLPAGCVLTNATLSLYNAFPVAGRTLEVRRAASAWAENGITWNNQPAVTGTAATLAMPGAAGYIGWNVTDQTNALYSNGNFGFRIADQSEGAGSAQTQIFGSRDSGAPPFLTFSIGS